MRQHADGSAIKVLAQSSGWRQQQEACKHHTHAVATRLLASANPLLT